jgi:hypothetical protein
MLEDDVYLSLVVTARNDDHGGSLLNRMQAFVNGWIGQCKRHGLSSELLVVDWNPPQDRPPLIDALRWPVDTHPCHVRVIQVPPEIHTTYRHAAALPLYQMIAKNVGIRRARGRFVLTTNIDILFSDELVRFLAEGGLESGRMYRIDRHDVMSDVPADATVDEQLEYCSSHLLRVNAREGTFTLTPDGNRALDREDIAHAGSGISFGSGWYGVERHSPQEVFRWVENDAEVFLVPPSDPPPPLIFDLEPGPGVRHQSFQLEVLDAAGTVLAQTWVRGRSNLQLQLPSGADGGNHFFFYVKGGGIPVADDLRILNFRVFRCRWGERASRQTGVPLTAQPGTGCSVESKSVSVTAEKLGFWRKAEKFAAAVSQDDSDKAVTITLPAVVRHILRAYYRDRGVRGVYRACLQRYRRPPALVAKAAAGQDIVEPESNIRVGLGWYDFEHFKGETFRWVRNDAELIVRCPKGPPQPLALYVEAGPGVNWRPFELQLLDWLGRKVAAVEVKKLERVELPVPWLPDRTQILRLHVEGGDRRDAGDPRLLNFRIFWLGWSAPAPGLVQESPTPGTPLEPSISLGAGWRAVGRDGDNCFEASRHAELVVQGPGPAPLVMRLDLSPAGREAIFVEIQDEAGRVLARGRLQGRQICYLTLPIRIESTQLFVLHCSSDFCLYHAGWADTPVDITEFAAGLKTVMGWSEIGSKEGELYRWIEQEATFEITVPAGPQRQLKLDLEAEAGPIDGVFSDDSGQVLARFQIAARSTILIGVPGQPGTRKTFCLRAPGVFVYRCEWARTGPEPANLHFRCEGIMAEPGETVIGDGITLGKGWYRTEHSDQGCFRWGSEQAEIFLESDALTQSVLLDIEAGPSQEDEVLEIDLLDRSYRRVTELSIRGREQIEISLPYQGGWPNLYRLALKRGGVPLLDDPRILNFRIFRVSCPQASAGRRRFARLAGPREKCSPALIQSSSDSNTNGATFLHTNACGDFTLMAREHWFDLRGYPEFDMYSFHIDSILCYAAHHGGVRETVLQEPLRIYHIEHGAGSGWTPEGQAKLFDRLRAKGIDWIEYHDLVTWARHMRKLNSPMIFNRGNWGLGGIDLPEMLVSDQPAPPTPHDATQHATF